MTIQASTPTIYTSKGIALGSICFSCKGSYSVLVQSPGYIKSISTIFAANSITDVDIKLSYEKSVKLVNKEYNLIIELKETLINPPNRAIVVYHLEANEVLYTQNGKGTITFPITFKNAGKSTIIVHADNFYVNYIEEEITKDYYIELSGSIMNVNII